ncbi:MAG: TetR/AcrR family transcriptional regulator [Neisseriaceae bacterium]|nr:MAG: TetR/AcrR family transcriptional regulator [Neisseriaceae bacterium]
MQDKKNKSETINTLLECGLELFGKYGYNSVTTKQIGEYSGLNSALVSYYFGGKKQYYIEVVRYVTDLIVHWFDDIEVGQLESKTVAELEELIKKSVNRFYEWFTSTLGASGTNLFFQELITMPCPEVAPHFDRAVSFITPFFINILTVYYRKTGRDHVNPVFVWILLISTTQNVSLHSSAPEEAQMAFAAAQIPQNILNLIINMP